MYIFYIIQYLNGPIYKKKNYSQKHCGILIQNAVPGLGFSAVYFQKSIIALPYRQRVTSVLSVTTKQFLSKIQQTKIRNVVHHSSRPQNIAFIHYFLNKVHSSAHQLVKKMATAAIKYCQLIFPSIRHLQQEQFLEVKYYRALVADENPN